MTDCAGLRGAREIAEEKTASLNRLGNPMTDISQERIAETVKWLRTAVLSPVKAHTDKLLCAADQLEALQRDVTTLQTLCDTKNKEMGEQDRHISAIAARLAEVEAMFRDCQEARDAAGFIGSVPDCIRYLSSTAEIAEARLSVSADPVCDDPGITTTLVSEAREQRMLEPVQGPFVDDDLPQHSQIDQQADRLLHSLDNLTGRDRERPAFARRNLVGAALREAATRGKSPALTAGETGEWRPTHRHRKGGEYRVLAVGTMEDGLLPVVIYEARNRTVWVRPQAEFNDGRFTYIAAPKPFVEDNLPPAGETGELVERLERDARNCEVLSNPGNVIVENLRAAALALRAAEARFVEREAFWQQLTQTGIEASNSLEERLSAAEADKRKLREALETARAYMTLCLGAPQYEGPDPYPIIDAALSAGGK